MNFIEKRKQFIADKIPAEDKENEIVSAKMALKKAIDRGTYVHCNRCVHFDFKRKHCAASKPSYLVPDNVISIGCGAGDFDDVPF